VKKTAPWAGLALLCIVFLFASCDIEPMSATISSRVANPENEGLEYLTITYHSDGHTSGNPPVDNNRYQVPTADFSVIPPRMIVEPVRVDILGQGTLEKEGHVFVGWTPRQHLPEEKELPTLAFQGSSIPVHINLDFDAVWFKMPPDHPKHFTITYHSEGHTVGEVPIDANKYTPALLYTILGTTATIIPPQIAVILEPNMGKDGYEWGGWKLRHALPRLPAGTIFQPQRNTFVFGNMDLDAVWLPAP